MLSFAPVQTGAADAAWAQAAAGRSLRDALDALDEARGSLHRLISDTEWRSDGVDALRALLIDISVRASREATEVRTREAEVAGIDLP